MERDSDTKKTLDASYKRIFAGMGYISQKDLLDISHMYFYMTNAVKQCNYMDMYSFSKHIPITRKVGKFTFRKNSLKYNVLALDRYSTEAIWARRYADIDTSLGSNFEFRRNGNYVGLVTNTTYKLWTDPTEIDIPTNSIPGFVFNSSCVDSSFKKYYDTFYYTECSKYSAKDQRGRIWESQLIDTKILFGQDRLLDIDLVNGGYDLLFYNYDNHHYSVMNTKFEVSAAGGIYESFETLMISKHVLENSNLRIVLILACITILIVCVENTIAAVLRVCSAATME
jgi:hypothetical protein